MASELDKKKTETEVKGFLTETDNQDQPSTSGAGKNRVHKLSALLQTGDIDERTLREYSSIVADIRASKKKNEAQKEFLDDYLRTLECMLQAKVRQSIRKADLAKPIDHSLRPEMLGTRRTTIKLNELVIRPEIFDGEKPRPRRWIEDYNEAIMANGWDEYIALKYFPTFLSRSAKDWFFTDVRPRLNEQTTWLDIYAAFAENYLGEADTEQLSQAVENMRQRSGESVSVFIPRLRRMMLMLTPDLPEGEQLRQIRNKLRPEYRPLLAYSEPKTITELRNVCLKIEAGQANKPTTIRLERNREQVVEGEPSRAKIIQRKPSSGFGIRTTITCYRCNRTGHIAKDCRAKAKADGTAISEGVRSSSWGDQIQKSINQVEGNESGNSEDLWEDKEEEVKIINHGCHMVQTYNKLTPEQQYITCVLNCNNSTLRSLVDTGASISILSDKSLQPDWVLQPCTKVLHGPDGKALRIIGLAKLRISLRIKDVEKQKTHLLPVVKDLTADLIMGLDLLKSFHLGIDIDKRRLHFLDVGNKDEAMRTIEETVLKPRSLNRVRVKLPSDGLIMAKPGNYQRDVHIAYSISEVRDSMTECLVLNPSNRQVRLNRNDKIGTYESVDDTPSASTSINQVIKVESETFSVGENLEADKIHELKSLIQDHWQAFSIKGSLGITNLLEHRIELLNPETKPVAEPLRRRPFAQIEETRQQVRHMLKEGIIEESDSPWASAYVLAKKKSGEYRLCVDFRRLNDLTKKTVYPLPNIDECLDTLSGKTYFSLLDFASGFWQVPMDKKSKEYTAFRTEDGLFQFRRMPFGLTNAPASFQKLINILTSGLKGLSLQAFIDDICVATSTWEEHLKILERLFQLVIKAGLKLKIDKCLFAATKVVFLGHEISQSGIRQDPSKLKALDQLPYPNDVPGIRRVLGLLSYYRKFVPNFAILSEPLTRLTRKGEPFVWGDEQKIAFQQLIAALKRDAILSHFNHRDPLRIKTDASRQGVAGLLLQKHGEDWKLICCCSRRLSKAEANYGITDLEGLAVVYTVNKLRHYLLGKHFEIWVDHCALCVLNRKNPVSARLKRWAIILSEFDFEIVYVKGGEHQDIDCLSRAPVDDPIDDLLENKVYHIVSPLIDEEWESEYENDESKNLFSKATELKEGLRIIGRHLYKDSRLYIPISKRDDVLKEAHSSFISGHGGIAATMARLRDVWWPNMIQDVKETCSNCIPCQQRKIERRLPSGTMQHFEAYEPFAVIAIDSMGPVAKSNRGNSYVIILIDVFTKFIESKAIPDVKAETTLDIILEFMGRFGVPRKIITDNGTQFANKLIRETLSVFGVEIATSTPEHSRGNAVAERLIQTYQEKLSIMIKVKEAKASWDVLVPLVNLALNSSYHQSNKFSPYELVFGKKLPNFNTGMTFQVSPLDLHASLIKLNLDKIRAEAVSNQSSAKARSEEQFERHNVPRELEIGDQVFVKVPHRRKTKLGDRYHGPFTITQKNKDIYTIRVEGGRAIERHVSHLKRYINNQESEIENNDAPSEAGEDRTMPDHLRDHDYINFSGLSNVPSASLSKVYEATLRQNAHLIEPSELPIINNTVILEADVLSRIESFFNACNDLYEREWKSAVKELLTVKVKERKQPFVLQEKENSPKTLTRKKRGVTSFVTSLTKDIIKTGLTEAFSFFAGNVVSNLVSGAFEYIIPGSNYNRINKLETQMEVFRQNFDIIKEVQSGTLHEIEKLAGVVQETAKRLNRLAQDLPKYSWVASELVYRIMSSANDLRSVTEWAEKGKTNTQALSRLFKLPTLAQIPNEDTVLHSIRRLGNDMFSMTFATRIRSKDTFVYRVHPFRHWDNITETPELMEYYGGNLLIYNETNNCIKAVDQPLDDRPVYDECLELDGEDETLNKWRAIRVADEVIDTQDSQVKKTLKWNYVYCFPGNITIEGKQYRCPVEVFRLPANKQFKTVDQRHIPNRVQLNASFDVTVDTIHIGQFEDDSDLVNELRYFDKINELKKQLKGINTDTVIVKHANTWFWSLIAMAVGLLTGLVIYSICKMYTQFKKATTTVASNILPKNRSSTADTYEMDALYGPQAPTRYHDPDQSKPPKTAPKYADQIARPYLD